MEREKEPLYEIAINTITFDERRYLVTDEQYIRITERLYNDKALKIQKSKEGELYYMGSLNRTNKE